MSGTPAHSQNYLPLIITLAALNAFAPVGTDMYLSSFAGIANSLQSDISQVQYSLSAYFIGLAVGQLGYAPIVSRYGLKNRYSLAQPSMPSPRCYKCSPHRSKFLSVYGHYRPLAAVLE